MTIVSLDSALADTQRVLLDTSTLIAFHNPGEATHPLARHILERIESPTDALVGYYSVVSATELLVRPLRTSVQRFTFMHVFLTTFPNLQLLPMDLAVGNAAALLRAVRQIGLADAAIIASGLLSGCEAVITNDRRWMNAFAPMFGAFRWVYLADHA